MTKSVGVHEAKTHLSKLIEDVARGDEVVITRRGEIVARLLPPALPTARQFGTDKGAWEVPEDINDPLPPEIQKYFE